MQRAAFAAPAWSLPETSAPTALLLVLMFDVPVTVVMWHIAMRMTMVVLEVDRMVMSVGIDPFIKVGLPLHDAIGRTITVFFDVRPRIEVEVIVELGVRSADGKNAKL